MKAKEELIKLVLDNDFITAPRLRTEFRSLLDRVEIEAQAEFKNCKKLKDLNEHNAQTISIQCAMTDNNPILNGIACPKCGEELYDSNPMVTIISMPAKKNVHCSKCDYFGYRIA